MSATSRRVVSVMATLVVLGGAAPAFGQPAPRVSVTFVDPARFTDVKEGGVRADAAAAAVLDELERFVRERGERDVPAGLTLEMRVTDVDLAGELEPWRGPQFNRVRLMRETSWPRIDFEFRLRDGQGQVVREGRRSLSDPTYLTRSMRVSDERLRYEKDLLAEWLRQEMAR